MGTDNDSRRIGLTAWPSPCPLPPGEGWGRGEGSSARPYNFETVNKSVPITIESLAEAALAGGADAIQLRLKGRPAAEVVEIGRVLAAACRAYGALFFVNDDVEAALACGADGAHIGLGDAAPAESRRLLGPERLLGVSVYTREDLALAEAARADYAAIGAVFTTATKAVPAIGLEGLRRWRARTRLPIVAIGGICAANAAAAIAAGADGVAVIAAVCAAPDPQSATREIAAAVAAALAARAS